MVQYYTMVCVAMAIRIIPTDFIVEVYIMAHSVNKDLCVGCGACEDTCPLGAISADADGKRVVDADLCVDCGACEGACPVGAIA